MKLLSLATKNLTRHGFRSLLTIAGVAAAMFLFAAVETMQVSLDLVTRSTAADTTLIVFRENRFCPSTSRLPEHYAPTIAAIPGVRQVIPVQITVNNCGASLDVITFRGVPPEDFLAQGTRLDFLSGDGDAFLARSDAALVGHHFAQRRGLKPGDFFEAVGVKVTVAGVIRSTAHQDNNVVFVHLPFLQQASRVGLGVVTQFEVNVESADDLDPVATAIDATFKADQQPTYTRPEQAFFADTARQMIELIRFARWLGLGAVLAVLALVANAVLLVVRARVKETAILQTIGFSSPKIATIVLYEGALFGLVGGALGVIAAFAFFHSYAFTFGNEGLTLAIAPTPAVLFQGLAVALAISLLASLYPALQAASQPLTRSLQSA